MADTVRASHILLMYDGSMRSTASRTKQDARELISDLHGRVKNGSDFADLARAHSDCPSGQKGGDLGQFGRGQMVPEFETATYALDVGGLSEVIETPFGFHIIQRTA